MKKLAIIACVVSSMFMLQNTNAAQNNNVVLSAKQVQFLGEMSNVLLHADEQTGATLLPKYEQEAESMGVSQYLAPMPEDCAAAMRGFDTVISQAIDAMADKELPPSTAVIAATGTLHVALVGAISAVAVPIYKKSCTPTVVKALNASRLALQQGVTAYLLVH
ncbi:MAG: hypothetical protein ACRC5A_14380 [Enterobacteriaceae bacterium]